MNLDGKVLALTGAGGIAEPIIKVAVQAGAKVYFTYFGNVDNAKRIESETGAIPFHFILGDQDSTRSFLYSLKENPIDYFISTAGVEYSGGFEQQPWNTSPGRKRDSIDQGIKEVSDKSVGNQYLVNALVGEEIMAEGGQISIVGSMMSRGRQGMASYAAANASLAAYVKSINFELERLNKRNIGVLLVEAMFVDDKMAENGIRMATRAITRANGEEGLQEVKNRHIIMTPEYAADKILAWTLDPCKTGVKSLPNRSLRELERYMSPMAKFNP